jgi:hypothetical protein
MQISNHYRYLFIFNLLSLQSMNTTKFALPPWVYCDGYGSSVCVSVGCGNKESLGLMLMQLTSNTSRTIFQVVVSIRSF